MTVHDWDAEDERRTERRDDRRFQGTPSLGTRRGARFQDDGSRPTVPGTARPTNARAPGGYFPDDELAEDDAVPAGVNPRRSGRSPRADKPPRHLLAQASTYLFLICGFMLGSLAMLLVVIAQKPQTYPVPPSVSASGSSAIITLDAPTLTTMITAAIHQNAPVLIDQISVTPLATDEIAINGTAHTGPASVAIAVVFAPTVDATTGTIKLRLVSANVGALQIPGLTRAIEGAVDAKLAPLGHGAIADGVSYKVIDARFTATDLRITANISA